MRGLRPSELRYRLLLLGIQGENDLIEAVSLGKKAPLRRSDGHVIGRYGDLGRWNDESGEP